MITPSDGYLHMGSGGQGSSANDIKWVTIMIDGILSNTVFNSPLYGGTTVSLFIKKGTKLKIGGNDGGGWAKFYPFV